MDYTEHSRLIGGGGGGSGDPHHNNHCNNDHYTTTTTTTTTTTQYTEDEVDGVLFNTGPHHHHHPHHHHPHHHPAPPLTSGGAAGQGGAGGPVIKVYLRRFWILLGFSFVALFQCLMWNTWGAISASVGAALPGWGADTVAMMGNWGTIMFVLTVTPMCWLMNTRGLRAGVLASAGLVAAGTVLRIVPLVFSDIAGSAAFFTVMCHLCAILVGVAGTLVMAAPPMVAAVWFPPRERTTATSFSQVMNMLGNTGSFLEPLMVREPTSPAPPRQEVTDIQADIQRLMYIWAGVGVALFVVLLVYFPAQPPHPPSLTSSVARLTFKQGLKEMVKNRDLVLVALSYGLSLGVPSAWTSVMSYSLYQLGMTQDEAMWVGVTSTLASVGLSLVVGRLTDLVYGHLKLSLIVLMALTLASLYWFFLLSWGTIPVSTWQIYTSVIGLCAFNYSTCPLFFELAVEVAYPCSEVMVGGLLTSLNNAVGLVFLFLFFTPFSNYEWVTYVLVACLSVAFLPLVWVREDYSRSSLDRSHHHSSAYQPI